MAKRKIYTYVDHDRYKHTVYYRPEKRKWVKLIHSPFGNYCSSMEGTKAQIFNQVSGMKKESVTNA